MKILFDTNVILDELLERQPFVGQADRLLTAVEHQELTGLLAATAVTTIHYITARSIGSKTARHAISHLLLLFDIAPVTHQVLTSALSLPFRDYEDAVIHEAARLADVDGIVTRDSADFQHATLPMYSPEELIRVLKARS